MAKIILTLSMVFFSLPQQGWATKVYSPIVSGGELEIEFQNDFILDADPAKNGASKHQLELAYGVTDRWQTGLYGVLEKKTGQSLSYTQTKWSNILQLFEQGEHWLDAGLYLEYIKPAASLQQPDVLELKLLLEKPVGELIHTLNVIVVKPLGHSPQGTTWEYAWRSLWNMGSDFQAAIEAYGALGRVGTISTPSGQNHLLGPVLRGKLFDDFKYDAGYLFGLTRGSVDGLIKLNFDYEF
ncbi:MAG TPA: hypothetical protein VKA31_08470 [Mariprofundaceae bacterium]|nr:hypothetical protein [Mariprofundaceae bacterium]